MTRTTGRRLARLTRILAAGTLATALLTASACTGSGGSGDDGDEIGSGDEGTSAAGTLRVLASSELADTEDILRGAAAATGVTVEPTWIGTLDATRQVLSGEAAEEYDAVWLASNNYLRLHPGAADAVTSATSIVHSPVALGVREPVARELGWLDGDVTWGEVHDAAVDGALSYGMTDPSRSNSGFSALISVTSALSGAETALTEEDIASAEDDLAGFFEAQALTSGSSGWLIEAYQQRAQGGGGTAVDAVINYESVLLSANSGAPAEDRLTVIRPADGVVTADYPLTLLTSASDEARTAFGELAEYLRTEDVQHRLTQDTLRRPVVPGVEPAAGLPDDRRPELPFPGTLEVADGLVESYEHRLRRPGRTVYVLDTSGSMEGERLELLKSSLGRLTGSTGEASDTRFRDREEVTLLPFADEVKGTLVHTVPEENPGDALAGIRADIDGLTAYGQTAVYDSLRAAYDHLRRRAAAEDTGEGDRYLSIVLMTDGESNMGSGAAEFTGFHTELPAGQRAVPVFPILFGESDRAQLENIATLTGGRLFDAADGSLDRAFEEIRGYQ